jgi:hypothetical protein
VSRTGKSRSGGRKDWEQWERKTAIMKLVIVILDLADHFLGRGPGRLL